MQTTDPAATVTELINATLRRHRADLTHLVSDPASQTWAMRHVVADGLKTLITVRADLDADLTLECACVWANHATDLGAHRHDEEAAYARNLSRLLTQWACLMPERDGDIGEPLTTEEGDEEPLTVPTEWPVPVEEPVGVPA